MNSYHFIASQYPLKEMKNQNISFISKNEVNKRRISAGDVQVTFETPDPEEKNILFFQKEEEDGSLQILPDDPLLYGHHYTEKKYVSKINISFTPILAKHLLAYIREHMEETGANEVELWDIWMGDTQSSTMRMCSLAEVTIDMIGELLGKQSFQKPEGLIITKE